MTPFATKDLLVTSLSAEFELNGDACDPTDTCTNRGSSECPCGRCGTGGDTNTSVAREEHDAALDLLMAELEGALR